MDPLSWCLLIHAAATGVMTGLIWFVQVVHYPMFADVAQQSLGSPDAAERFAKHEQAHQQRTTLIVLPTMTVELITAGLLLFWLPPGTAATLAWAGFVLLLLIWASTFFIQVPCHQKLARGFQEKTHRRLVASNWLRTAGWSARFAVALWLLILN